MSMDTFDEVDRAWMDEALRRYGAIKSGRARTLSHDEVFARLKHAFNRDERDGSEVGPCSPLSEAWKAELDRRAAELDAGRVELIDNEEVFASVRASLRDGRVGQRSGK